MKRINLLSVFIICTFFFQTSFGQVQWGPRLSISKHYSPRILGSDDNSFYTFAYDRTDYYLEKYKADNLEQIFSKKIEIEEIKKDKVLLEGITIMNGKYIFLASEYVRKSKKSKKHILYAYSFSTNTGQKLGARKKLFEFDVDKKRRKGTYSVFVTPDKSKLLINFMKYEKKQKITKDLYYLLDLDLNIITQKHEIIDKGIDKYSTYNYIIDNDGTFYFIKSYSEYENYIVSFDANNDYEKWEEKIMLSELKRNEKVRRPRLKINSDNDLILTGYYTKDKLLHGCFFLKLDQVSKETKISKLHKFDGKLKQSFKTQRDIKKGKSAEIGNIFNRNIIVNKSDGSIFQIGEDYAYRFVKYDHGWRENYYFGDLLLMNFNTDGDLLWVKRLPKDQNFWQQSFYFGTVIGSLGIRFWMYPVNSHKYFSYLAYTDPENLYVIFNDNPKNIDRNIHEHRKTARSVKKTVPCQYTFNLKTGEMEKKLFLESKDFEIVLKSQVYFQEKQNDNVIIYGQNKRKAKYGIIKMNGPFQAKTQ